MAIWTNEGLLDKVRSLLGLQQQPAYALLLYVNDVTPSVVSTLPDFVECTLGGYERVLFTALDWTISVAGGLVTATYPPLTFSLTANAGGVTLFGYVVLNTLTQRTAWAERFATPFPVPAAGGSLTLQLTFYDQGL